MKASQVAAIEKFASILESRIEENMRVNYPNVYAGRESKVLVSYGKKYAKIITQDNVRNHPLSISHKAVHCFIEIETGDIYKAASWAAPAKHVRGNVNTPDCGMSAVGVYGANYLRG